MRLPNSLRRLRQLLGGGRHGGRRAQSPPPAVELLEDRTTPSVVFWPRFGPETVTANGDGKLPDVKVNLVFWGSYWLQGDGALARRVIITDVGALLGTPYLSGLAQYGGGIGYGGLGQVAWDSAHDPGPVVTRDNVLAEVGLEMLQGAIPPAITA